MAKKKIYLDYAATTPVDLRVLRAMEPFLHDRFGNPASLHSFGQDAQDTLEKCREQVAGAIGASSEEVIFTASATESNNTSVKGIAFANTGRGRHILISAIEHDCIIESARWLEKQGFTIEKIPVDSHGLIDPQDVKKRLRKDTILVSVMHANNEIGTVEPISQIGKICREHNVPFHVDASQSLGKIPLNVGQMNIDLLTASSHKMYGPKGAALLFVRKGIKIVPLLHGGGQELGLRSSTVNIPAVVGFSKAIELCLSEMDDESKRISVLRDKLIKGIIDTIPQSYLNGHPQKRLPNNINIRFSAIEGEAILLQLDSYEIAVSTGSACSSRNLLPSHVLVALGLKPQEIHGSVRISLGRWTTEKEIDTVLQVLPAVIGDLRKISPFWKGN